jgi:hypothetical protein
MTTADFVAACFWPLVILFVVLLNTVRDPVLLRWIGAIIKSGTSFGRFRNRY